MHDAINWLKRSSLSLRKKKIAMMRISTMKAHLPLVSDVTDFAKVKVLMHLLTDN